MEDTKRKYNMNGSFDGNAVKKNQELSRPDREQYEFIRSTVTEKTKHRPKVRLSHGIDMVSLLILMGAIAATFIICFRYLQIQADIVDLQESVSSLSSACEKIQAENDALEDALAASTPDLEYVYQIAVGKLGMVYPNNNTVYYYSGDNDSFYHQYGDIPE